MRGEFRIESQDFRNEERITSPHRATERIEKKSTDRGMFSAACSVSRVAVFILFPFLQGKDGQAWLESWLGGSVCSALVGGNHQQEQRWQADSL
jgi:hypothetical protein